MKHWLLLVLLGALLAACGDGDGEPEVSGGGNIGWVDIDEPINGNGIYTTRASSIEIGGNGLPAKTPTLSFYDPATDSWRATSNQCEPYLSAGDFYAHWTGSRLFAWSNADAGGYFYDPASDNWQSIVSRVGLDRRPVHPLGRPGNLGIAGRGIRVPGMAASLTISAS